MIFLYNVKILIIFEKWYKNDFLIKIINHDIPNLWDQGMFNDFFNIFLDQKIILTYKEYNNEYICQS